MNDSKTHDLIAFIKRETRMRVQPTVKLAEDIINFVETWKENDLYSKVNISRFYHDNYILVKSLKVRTSAADIAILKYSGIEQITEFIKYDIFYPSGQLKKTIYCINPNLFD